MLAQAHAESPALLQQALKRIAARWLNSTGQARREVMKLVTDGRPNKLIADELGISVRTVKVHRARVFDKMKVRLAVEPANLLAQLQRP